MAARKTAAKRAPDPPPLDDDDELDVELAQFPAPKTATEERRERQLEDILSQIGNDGRIVVWHVINGRSSYAGSMSLDGFSLDALLDTYGGGDKSLVIYQGTRQVETVRVNLDPSIPPTSPRARLATTNPPTTAPGSQSVADMAAMLTAMSQVHQQQMQSLVLAMGERSAMSEKLLTALLPALVTRTGGGEDSLLKAVEVIGRLRPEGGNMKEMFSLFDRGLALGRGMNPTEGDEVTGLIGKGLDSLNLLISGIMNKRAEAAAAASGQPSLPPGAPIAEVPPPAPPASAAHSEPVMPNPSFTNARAWLQKAGPLIVQFRPLMAHFAPETAAAALDNALTDQELDDLADDLNTPGFVERLDALFPGLLQTAETQKWIGRVIEILMTEDDEPAADPTPKP